MCPRNDNRFYAIAEEIQQLRPGWLVIFGCYSRLWWAYPLFAVRRRVILSADNPETLIARMDAADRDLRIRGEHGQAHQPGSPHGEPGVDTGQPQSPGGV
jgi:hypothetical protein